MMYSRFHTTAWLGLLALLSCFFAGAGPATAAAPVLVDNGTAKAVIVLPAEPQPRETQAADELALHIEKISGARLPIIKTGEPLQDHLPIRIGAAADATLETVTRKTGDDPAAFTLRVAGDAIDLRGLSGDGTYIAACELLEQLGVRWYMPGDWGTVIPQAKTVTLREQTTTQSPSIHNRFIMRVATNTPWIRRARLDTKPPMIGTHGMPGYDADDFAAHPEYFSLVNGKRTTRQDCLSNSEVLKRAVAAVRKRLQGQTGKIYLAAGPRDGAGFCECPACMALDQAIMDPTANRVATTDRYVWFFNRMLEELQKDYPDLHIVTYAYGGNMMPPKIKPNPRIVPSLAPITLDRTRGMDNPMSPDRYVLRSVIDGWASSGVTEMYYRGYLNNLACPQFPFGQIDAIISETRAFHKLGVSTMSIEAIHPSWSNCFLNFYVAGKVMWNVDTNMDAMLDEFYTLYYGPAREPMKRYHEGVEAAFRDTPWFAGSAYLYFPIFLDHPRRAQLRACLDEAETAIRGKDPVYAQRLTGTRLGWDRMELFLDIVGARNRHDYATSMVKQKEFMEITQKGIATVLERTGRGSKYDPMLIFEAENTGAGYYNRFFRRPTVFGYERTVEIGDLVAGMPDEWLFLTDPTDIGKLAGYQRPGILGGNWQPMKTSSRSWSDQGLHYYKGIAWYRQKITIPKQFAGRKVYLWFGAVDEIASVWINGKYVGTSRQPEEGLPGVPGAFLPFDLPATDAIKFGEENWVVVRIENLSLSEVGTGGIVAPVMFWSPKGEWKPAAKFDGRK